MRNENQNRWFAARFGLLGAEGPDQTPTDAQEDQLSARDGLTPTTSFFAALVESPLPAALLSAGLAMAAALWLLFAFGSLWFPIGVIVLSAFCLVWSSVIYWRQAAIGRGSDLASTISRARSSIILSEQGQLVTIDPGLQAKLNLAPDTADVLAAMRRKVSDPPALERLINAAKSGLVREEVLSFSLSEGRTRHFLSLVNPAPKGGAWLQFVDVSQMQIAFEAEKGGRKWFSDFLEALPFGVFTLDEAGAIIFANRDIRDRLGLSITDVQEGRRRFSEFIDIRCRDRGDGEDWLTVEGIEGRFRAAIIEVTGDLGYDGPRRFVLMPAGETGPRLAPGVTTGQGARSGVAIGGLRAFFEDAPVGVLLADAEGRISHCNRAFYKLLGQHRDLIVGKSISELVASEDQSDLNAQLSKIVMGAARVAHLEVNIPAAGERLLMTSLFAGRLEDDLGEMTGLVVHVLDNTERKNLEEQFGQSQKMQAVGQLAGGVAHDFNNLLTAMIGFTDLLIERHGENDPDFADLMQIKQNANRATNLVRQLLAFSRKQKLKPEVMDPAEALNDLQNLLSRLIGENIKLEIEHGQNIGLIRADRGQFDQVIINLVVNARDAMVGGGTVTITSQSIFLDSPVARGSDIMDEGNYVLITVADSGCGIAKEDIGRIFEPFFSTKDVGQGTGLGLSTVYGIIHQTGGFIFVESAVGTGTEFKIYLPVDEMAEEERKINPNVGRFSSVTQGELALDLGRFGAVLMVEDEQAVRTFAARALRNKGYTVIEAEDGEDALEKLNAHENQVDLLLSDISMPGMDGKTLVRLVREIVPDIKVILMSGYAEDLHLEDNDGEIPEHFLAKPFTLKALAAKVSAVMGED